MQPVDLRPGVAFFDFDGTLIQGDSLLPYLALFVGRQRVRLALLSAMRTATVLHARRRGPCADLRGSIKAVLVRQCLSGVPVVEARAAAERLVPWVRWKRPQLDALKAHRKAGRQVVVATGALDIYMPSLLGDLEVDGLLATDLEVVDGALTGRLAGGNCVRAHKADRVAAFLRERGPFAETWGYGNRPSDLPMLALVQNRVVV